MAAPKSDREKKLAGTYRKDRARRVSTDHSVPVMPKWLSTPARREWKALIPKLKRLGLASVDGGVLGVYCQSLADIGTLESEIRERGHTFETPKGYIAKHPACTLLREARQTVLRAGAKLGLNPTDRRGMPALEEESLDELTAYQLEVKELTCDKQEFLEVLASEGVTIDQYRAAQHRKKKRHFFK